VAHRVLVIDDVDEVRALTRRVLEAGGYEVNAAATLTEARSMNPGSYDAVIVDAHIGTERGIDLVYELQAQDPAAARKCLIVTGGTRDTIPPGVAYLAKPFKPDQLRNAVRGLHQPAIKADRQRAGVNTGDHAVPPLAPDPPDSSQPAAGRSDACELLSITRSRRRRERHALADLLHDDPIQELTAAALELQLMRRSATSGQAQALDSALQRLDAASGSLRRLVETDSPLARPATGLAAALRRQTAWLLAAPITVATNQPATLGQPEILFIADVVELVLLALVPAGLQALARVATGAGESVIQIELTVTLAEDNEAIGEPDTARTALDRLAFALRASVHSELCERQWRVRLALPRPSEDCQKRQGPAASKCLEDQRNP
jgi:DNA-binding response OmpR family regulator